MAKTIAIPLFTFVKNAFQRQTMCGRCRQLVFRGAHQWCGKKQRQCHTQTYHMPAQVASWGCSGPVGSLIAKLPCQSGKPDFVQSPNAIFLTLLRRE